MSCIRKKIPRNNPVVKVSVLIWRMYWFVFVGMFRGLFVYLLKCTFWNRLLQEHVVGKRREII